MADVSRAGLPSSSSKHVYDGVFSSSKVKSTVFASFNDDDYGEIFRCLKSDNGGWQSSCSIPVVELPASEQRIRGVRGIEMDYGGVFGGFSDEGLNLINGDELFDQLKKKARTSPPVVSVSRNRSKEQTKEVTESRIPSNSQSVQPSLDDISKLSEPSLVDISKSSDGVKQYKQKTNDTPPAETNGTRLVGRFDSTSGPTFTSHERALLQEVQNSRTPPAVKDDAQFDKDMPTRETHSGNSSSDLRANNQKIEHETHEFTNQTNGASDEVDSPHKAPVSETPTIQSDTEVEVDVNLTTKGKHSKHSSLDIGVNEHKSDVEFDAENNIGVNEFSNSDPTKQNTETHFSSYQESGSSSSNFVGFDSGKNLQRHSRMTSLDLGRQASDHDDVRFRRKSRLGGGSYSFDASHDPSVARVKLHPSKVIPSSSEPHIFHMESRYKISENSKSNSPLVPSLDDQLDMNSLAAISASALHRAIEEAEMQIRLAKEFLERESRGCTSLRFKDTLKEKVMKENKHVNTVNNAKKEKKIVEDHSRVDEVTFTSSTFRREGVLETSRFVPVVEDRKKFLKESITNAEAPECIEGGKNEGGEWEATKHLNQIISGVKNRLASFMAWQVENEKKEELKEVESIEEPHSSAHGGCEPKESNENHTVITSANESENEENVTGVAPQHVESEEKGSTSTNFLFFTFSRTGNKQAQTSEEIESEIRLKGDEANAEVRVNNSMSQDYGERFISSIYEECMATMKEHYPMEAHDMNRFIHEDDDGGESSQDANVSRKEEYVDDCAVDVGHRDDRVIDEEHRDDRVIDEEHGVDRIELSDEEEAGDKRVIEEGEDDGCGSILEANNKANEECGSDTDALIHEADDGTRVNEECGDDTDASFHEADDETTANEEYASINEDVFIVEDDNDEDEIEVFEEPKDEPDNEQLVEKIERASEQRSESPVKERDQCEMYYTEEDTVQMNEVEEGGYRSKAGHVEETTKKDVEQGSCMEVVETEFSVENGKTIENNDFPSSDVEISVGTPVLNNEESEEKMEITNHSSEPEIGLDRPVLLFHTAIDCIEEKSDLMSAFDENSVKFIGIERHNGTDLECENPVLPECEMNVNCATRDVADDEDAENDVEFDGVEDHSNTDAPSPCENSAPHDCDTDVDRGERDINDGNETELKSEDILENQAEHLHDSQEAEKCNVEGVHRRRRWFENVETVDVTKLVVDDDTLEETELDGSVKIHADKVDRDTTEAVNVETTHKRRRWFVNMGDEGFPEPPSLFEGTKVSSQLEHEVDECVSKSKTEDGEVVGAEKDKPNVEPTPRRKRWFESAENMEPTKNPSHEDDRTTRDNVPSVEEKNDVPNNAEPEPANEPPRETDEETRRKKEREKERIAVERAIREARERAFAEAKERAKRDAVDRPPNRVTCQKSGGGEGGNSASDRAAIEAKIRAERAAVERATAEVRERALQKALSEKASQRSGRYPLDRSSSLDPKYSSSSHSRSSDPLNNGDKFDGVDGESAQRRKARLERQNRTMERAAKALEEKNKRDLLVQKEQAARNILADALDAEVKRWSSGKEGNVRALLSTLQYILGSDSGWKAVSLTDLIAPTAVRKAYKKATLCVHPDKLQQRSATIQQKYVCEKVFDLLKDAWSRFNPEER